MFTILTSHPFVFIFSPSVEILNYLPQAIIKWICCAAWSRSHMKATGRLYTTCVMVCSMVRNLFSRETKKSNKAHKHMVCLSNHNVLGFINAGRSAKIECVTPAFFFRLVFLATRRQRPASLFSSRQDTPSGPTHPPPVEPPPPPTSSIGRSAHTDNPKP
jgi:hypothetical protein